MLTSRPMKRWAFPAKSETRICFAHPAYLLAERFASRRPDVPCLLIRSNEELMDALPHTDVLVISQMWRNEFVEIASRLRFIQGIGAGFDQFDHLMLRRRGIRLATSAGVTSHAVAEHAMALMLALYRHLHTGRDNQKLAVWRGMISDIASREDELAGKTLLLVGFGRIGARIAKLAKAFDMRVVVIRGDPDRGAGEADVVFGRERLREALAEADVLVLACPLTPETRNLIDDAAFAVMKPSAQLINVARGAIVDEDALIQALQSKRLAAAGIDVVHEEPLPRFSPLWGMPNVLITPHKAGETRRLEDGVIAILIENLELLWQGEPTLRNQVV